MYVHYYKYIFYTLRSANNKDTIYTKNITSRTTTGDTGVKKKTTQTSQHCWQWLSTQLQLILWNCQSALHSWNWHCETVNLLYTAETVKLSICFTQLKLTLWNCQSVPLSWNCETVNHSWNWHCETVSLLHTAETDTVTLSLGTLWICQSASHSWNWHVKLSVCFTQLKLTLWNYQSASHSWNWHVKLSVCSTHLKLTLWHCQSRSTASVPVIVGQWLYCNWRYESISCLHRSTDTFIVTRHAA